MQSEAEQFKGSIARKNLIGIICLILLFAAGACVVGYYSLTSVLLDEYIDDGYRIADTASLEIDPDWLETWLETGGAGEEYRQSWNEIDALCNSFDTTFIYVIRPDQTDYGHVVYIFSTVNHSTSYTPYKVGFVKETSSEEYRVKYQAMMEGKSDREVLVLDSHAYDLSLHHITVMTSLKGSDGETKALMCIQRQLDELVQVRRSHIWNILAISLVVSIIAGIANGIFQHRVILTPIQKITAEASRFARENVTTGTKLTDEIRNNDEIGLLASSIDRMEEQVVRNEEDIARFTAEHERVATELSLAARIQKDVLPDRFPAFPDRAEFDLYAEMDPAREVGGDFYDFFLIDDDHLCLVIADVSGKGIPGALFMMASKNVLKDIAVTGCSPAEILTKANLALFQNNKSRMFVTVWLGILEISTGRLTAANGGHEYPVLKRPSTPYEIYKDKHGFVIGMMEKSRYSDYELQMEPGTKIFVYTDGVTEATDGNSDMFGTENMVRALNEKPDAGPEGVIANMRLAVDRFVNGTEQFDDLTMLCLEYRGTGNNLNV